MSKAAHLRSIPQATPDDQAAEAERRNSLLRMVSHELRTPLNSILGFSEILTSELYGPLGAPQYKEYAAIIRGSGQKLLGLVNQVLELARLEVRGHELTSGPEALDSALEDVLATLREDLGARGTQVAFARADDLPLVMADARGLRTVLFNLLHNAIAYSPGGGQVRVRVERLSTTAEIVIVNRGDGVDPADLPRLMQPFQQGENALTRHSQGAGLGLPISDLTCRAMGGTLRLSGRAGHGVIARVRLPLA